jgi:large conductance mechanosensitive channel
MLKEFKEFALRGNVLDLAIGVIIGGAFGKIITSLVNDIIMPPIGVLLGNVNFSDLYWNLSGGNYASLEEAQAAGAATSNYGLFINTIIDFLLVALVVFFIVKFFNNLRRKEEKPAADPTTKKCTYCKSEIAIEATRCPMCTSQLEKAESAG